MNPLPNTLLAISATTEMRPDALGTGFVLLARYALPRGTVPSSVAFYRGALMPAFQDNLLIASEEGRHLFRVRFDSADPKKVTGTEKLLQNAIGGVRVVAVSPGGLIYLATADAIATLATAE